jgi:glycyl-tRNA synthetase alpha chain
VQQTYLESLEACGINPRQHDIRFEEDNWEVATLGAWGIGWQVMLDGHGDHAVHLLPADGRHRPRADLLRDHLRPRAHRDVPAARDNVFDLEWGGGVKYGEVRLQEEIEESKYAFGQVDMPAAEFAALHRDLFDKYLGFSTGCSRRAGVAALEHC